MQSSFAGTICDNVLQLLGQHWWQFELKWITRAPGFKNLSIIYVWIRLSSGLGGGGKQKYQSHVSSLDDLVRLAWPPGLGNWFRFPFQLAHNFDTGMNVRYVTSFQKRCWPTWSVPIKFTLLFRVFITLPTLERAVPDHKQMWKSNSLWLRHHHNQWWRKQALQNKEGKPSPRGCHSWLQLQSLHYTSRNGRQSMPQSSPGWHWAWRQEEHRVYWVARELTLSQISVYSL